MLALMDKWHLVHSHNRGLIACGPYYSQHINYVLPRQTSLWNSIPKKQRETHPRLLAVTVCDPTVNKS